MLNMVKSTLHTWTTSNS